MSSSAPAFRQRVEGDAPDELFVGMIVNASLWPAAPEHTSSARAAASK